MKGRGRKRVAQPQSEEGESCGEKENKRGEIEEQIVETEGLGENKKEEEDEENEEDDVEEQEVEEGGEEEEERTRLDDGFFEIEAIRRKRVRKVWIFFLLLSNLS